MAETDGQVQEAERVEVRGVSMYQEDWMEVKVLARTRGISISGALRQIVREWRDLHEPKPATGNGDSGV
jgi:hypothetical protein